MPDDSERSFGGHEILSWDSEQFGFPVARLGVTTSIDELLATAEAARQEGVRLAYYFLSASMPLLPEDALSALGGRLVDTRRTYLKTIDADGPISAAPELQSTEITISPYEGSTTDPRLADLAFEAGAFSRFRVDPRIDASVFESIYRIWITRSIRREIADEVLVACRANDMEGFITWRQQQSSASIGLVAVSQRSRGRGIATRLLLSAEQQMAMRGCSSLSVVTQGANRDACAFYESRGFELASAEYVYHLWLR